MTAIKSIRLNPTDNEFLDQYSMNSGDLFYDKDQKTLVLFDGIIRGGIPLLRADLSNISGGGGGGSGIVNFGAKTIQAQAFIGDGSQITNLPIPPNVATTDYVDNAFATPATQTTLGTVKIGTGLSVTVDGLLTADGIADITELLNLTGLKFQAGVQINEFSSDVELTDDSDTAVPTEKAVKTYVDTSISSAISSIDLDANGIVSPGLASELAFYAVDGSTVSSTGQSLTWDAVTNKLSTFNAYIDNNLEIGNHIEVLGTAIFDQTLEVQGLATFNDSAVVTQNIDIGGDLYLEGSANVKEIFNDRLGVVKFTSGADFVIDAPGFVNVSNSRIVNLGNPLLDTDAVNKAYVDGAASQFTGGTVPNPIIITSTQASSSTSTGALVVSGGGGIGGALYVGGTIFSNGSPVLTSLSGGFNGGTITGTIFVNNITQSSSVISGAIRTTGGVGIARTLNVGGEARFNGIYVGNGTLANGEGFVQNTIVGGGNPFISNSSGLNNTVFGFNALSQITDGSDNVAIGFQSQQNRGAGSSNIAIGSDSLLQNNGSNNIAIGHQAGNLLLTGDGNVILGGNSGADIDALNNHVVISDGAGNVKIQINNSGAIGIPTQFGINYGTTGSVLQSTGSSSLPIWASLDELSFNGGTVENITSFTNQTDSTSAANGAVVITGGLGVGKATNIAGILRLTSNTASTATNNGALVVTGGMGISGDINSSGSASFSGSLDIGSTAADAVIIAGGAQITGTLTAGSIQNAIIGSVTPSTGTFTTITGNALNVTGNANIERVTEQMVALTNATGTVVHNTESGAVFYHTTPSANFTANFTNVPTTNTKVLTFVLIIIQGATAFIPSAVQINGAAPTAGLQWANNTTPTGAASRPQIFTFHVIRQGNTYRVLGSAQSY
jgi:hypothetical protein